MARKRRRRVFGDRDPAVPISIVAPILTLLVLATITVGNRPIHIPTWLAVIAVAVWAGEGLWMVLIGPILTWTLDDVKYKWPRMFISIIVGIIYFIVSFVLMFHFSISN